MPNAGQIVVAGVGMTRFGKYSDRGMRSLAEEAVHDALGDAAISCADVPARGRRTARGVGLSETGGGFLGRDAAAMSVHIFSL